MTLKSHFVFTVGEATPFSGQRKALRCGYNLAKKPVYAKSHQELPSFRLKDQVLNI